MYIDLFETTDEGVYRMAAERDKRTDDETCGLTDQRGRNGEKKTGMHRETKPPCFGYLF